MAGRAVRVPAIFALPVKRGRPGHAQRTSRSRACSLAMTDPGKGGHHHGAVLLLLPIATTHEPAHELRFSGCGTREFPAFRVTCDLPACRCYECVMSRSLQSPSLKPRKIPNQARAAETVEAIIEAAAQVLETEGFEGFNTNAIAQRAGVSIGSLYQYFPGKDALTIALMHRQANQFRTDAEIALAEPTAEAALENLIGAAVRQQLQRPTLGRLLDIEESRPAFRQQVTSSAMFQSLLVMVMERKDMPPQKHADVAVGDILALIRGMVDAAGERGETDAADLKRRVKAAVFGYLSGTAV